MGRSASLNGRPMISVTPHISIDEKELVETFVRASGPGGQNVNKLSTAVELRFDVRASPGLTDEVRARLAQLAGRRMTRDGILVIDAQRFRTQERNREDARARLLALITEAAQRRAKRRPTRPTRASKERRLDEKAHRGKIKSGRQGLGES